MPTTNQRRKCFFACVSAGQPPYLYLSARLVALCSLWCRRSIGEKTEHTRTPWRVWRPRRLAGWCKTEKSKKRRAVKGRETTLCLLPVLPAARHDTPQVRLNHVLQRRLLLGPAGTHRRKSARGRSSIVILISVMGVAGRGRGKRKGLSFR
ncbi:hypothetical protein IWX50DRAFT_267602 [Phyllosticta citricarpa]